MGQSPEELKQDVESTRADLSDTLDAIGDRVSPGRMIERRKNRMRQGLDTSQPTPKAMSPAARGLPCALRVITSGTCSAVDATSWATLDALSFTVDGTELTPSDTRSAVEPTVSVASSAVPITVSRMDVRP